ncbi:hypothetical protein OF83DRAFT_1063810 [Amylostereum chailletii]|nr:hypothetical protein OF83DRAFT_1063810 [Amylostereum chailletii]
MPAIPSFLRLGLAALATSSQVLYDGRAPSNITAANLDASSGPYLSGVKGSEAASHYTTFLDASTAPGTPFTAPGTPLWPAPDNAISITIDNTSIFTPGANAPQNGFRRTELIAQPTAAGADRNAFNAAMESGTTAFHFSVQADAAHPLNVTHEYQVVWIEPSDGSHVFDLQIGTPFNTAESAAANSLRIRAHDGTVLFATAFAADTWHNFAVAVDWAARTLQTFYSADAAPLSQVTDALPNASAGAGAAGQGDFHFGVLKLPLPNPSDTPANQGDVVHFGLQEGSTDGLLYSGVFVEGAENGVSVGGAASASPFNAARRP